MRWLSRLRIWQQKQIHGSLSVSSNGVSLEKRGFSAFIRWGEIVKIEVERVPTITVDAFFVMLSDERGKVLDLDEELDGFKSFEDAMFERWPEIKKGWVAIYRGNPQFRERATLWMLPKNSY